MEDSEDRRRSVNTGSTSSSVRLRLGLLSQSHSLLNPRQGLLSQTQELLHNPTIQRSSTMGSAQSSHSTVDITDQPHQGNGQRPTGSRDTTNASATFTSASSSSNSFTSATSSQASSSSGRGALTRSSSRTTTILTELRQTLNDSKLILEFRLFLRTNPNLDKNRSDDPEYKKKNEQWLDFVIICEQVFELPEDENERKINLMVEIGKKFFGRPPDGYNMALQNQVNRKELIAHCKNLSESVTNEPDVSLLRDGYEYVYGKLDQKHDLFKKTYKPTTRLAALMCALS